MDFLIESLFWMQLAAGRIEWYVQQLSFRLAHKPDRCFCAEWSKKTNTGKSTDPSVLLDLASLKAHYNKTLSDPQSSRRTSRC